MKPNKLAAQQQTRESEFARARNKFAGCLLHFLGLSGMVQLVARGPLEPKILVRVQVPEPLFDDLPAQN